MRQQDEGQYGLLERFQPIGDARVFLVEKQTWTVAEVVDRIADTRALLFSSLGIARRVSAYPGSWRELSDAALYEVSLGH